MFALTNAPAHLLILVAPERITIIADPVFPPIRDRPTSLIGDRVTKILCATGHSNTLLDFVSMLRNLDYTAVTLSDE